MPRELPVELTYPYRLGVLQGVMKYLLNCELNAHVRSTIERTLAEDSEKSEQVSAALNIQSEDLYDRWMNS